ncbi:MAG: toxin VapC, partial [Sulfolobus sp.]|nr:toxin VapC [Sulfolobus sp.]
MRILIDTPFLLPILGIEVKPELNRIIEKFPNHEIYYSEFSLLEVLWILKRINKKGVKVEMKRLREGLRSLRA